MAKSKITVDAATKIAEKAAIAAIGVGGAVLFVTNKKFRDAVTGALGSSDTKTAQKPSAAPPTASSVGAPNGAPNGVVYLLRAGPFYKIGKASDFDRRLRQIKLQLPYPVEVVHTIACADISHVETLWHKRFASRRQTGEWFVLTDEEVQEFTQHVRM